MAVQVKTSTQYIVQLTDLSPGDAARAGSKATNEAELRRAGFTVPYGIVLTTEAFEHFLAANNLTPDSPPKTIAAAAIPADIAEALQRALAAMGDEPLAVRSSAIAEDLPGASFAGQYETILNVRGAKALEEALLRCWASVFNPHVVAYRQQHGLGMGSMAVLIQRLVQADVAGVAFTANPVTGDRDEVVINAVRGLGERLVSGEASPDEWTVKGQDVQYRRSPEGAIEADQARAIADMARRVESHFGAPQDIEWALADGQLYVLQARPITTLLDEAIELIPVPIEVPAGYWEHDASHFPEPIYPMHRLLYGPVRVAVKNWVEDFGYLFEGVEIVEIGGWVYQRIAPLGGKEGPPLPKPLMWLLVRIIPFIRRRIRQAVETMRTDKPGRYVRQWYAEHQPELAARIAELQEVDLAALSDEVLNSHIDAVMSLVYRGLEVHTYAHGSLAIILYNLATICEELLGWDTAKTFALVDGTSFKSTEPARRLHELAQMARAHPGLRALLNEMDNGIVDRLGGVNAEFAQAFAAYLKTFGCRLLNEISEPTLAETPSLLLGQIRNQINRGYDPQADQAALAQRREATAAEARNALAGRPEDLARFEGALEPAKLAYPVREDNEFFTFSAPGALVRYAVLELGTRLAARGVIDQRDDIFFLELEEARSVLNATSSAAGVDNRALVRQRKGARAWAIANPGAPSYGPEPPPPPDLSFLPREARMPMEAMLWSLDSIMALKRSGQNQLAGSALTGIAASPGQYTGPVRVIMSEAEFHKLRPGDVLVCPITSPVWSVIFPSVGALVTDSGGILSHPAIIAREYRVPAVVAMGNATALLQDEEIVTVDGTAGIVKGNSL